MTAETLFEEMAFRSLSFRLASVDKDAHGMEELLGYRPFGSAQKVFLRINFAENDYSFKEYAV